MTTRPIPSAATSRRTVLLAAAVALLFAAPLRAAPDYTSLAGVKAGGFQKWLDDAKDQGYLPIYINGYDLGDHAEFAGVATKVPDHKPFESRFDMTDDGYREYFKEMSDKGFRLQGLSGYHSKGGPRYAAVWVQDKNKVEWKARHNQTEKEFGAAIAEMRDDEYYPTCVTAYQASDGGVRYTAIFVHAWANAKFGFKHNMTADQLADQMDKWRSDGFRVLRVHAYDTPDGLRFLAEARKTMKDDEFTWQERHGLTGEQYQKAFDKLAGDDYRPICICGYLDSGQVHFAAVWAKKKN